MKKYKIKFFGKRLEIWKWGCNFNEGGHFTFAINMHNLWFYLGMVVSKKPELCPHGVPDDFEHYCLHCNTNLERFDMGDFVREKVNDRKRTN